ncbi:hypothetical protein LIER_39151 [Lithospermum erythrorhizon]|uniref:Uncharacterized protein n=1 Tax=Lithospermum erythrorhizon TaxID=34254 RepID=A0AAV3QBP5_LITER
MGTQIQSETYFLRHCSRNLSRNISTGRWLSYQDGKVLENIQHENLSSPWQGLMDKEMGGEEGCEITKLTLPKVT